MSGSVPGGTTKRAWKLQEFVAHGADVNCLSLGHKSGRVLVTGGEDKKVNLWAVGKPNCIMSLSGHSTGIECVRFGTTEELVCAGSQSGALKIWDLEAAKLLRTLTGHKSGVKCLDFHPYGDFLCSGSSDTSLRLWDTRRKGCIFSYKGHTSQINKVKFSPDGQWIASAGAEGVVKIWDLRAGKQLTELVGHTGPVTDVEFHPHEFLLASSSEDRSVCLWDLESFSLIGGGGEDGERNGVRCIYFHPEGDCLFSGTLDTMKVLGWEPVKALDTVPIGWGKINDIAIASNQLIGASHHTSHVQIWVVDLKRVQPFGGVPLPEKDTGKVTVRDHPVRRSFIKEKPEAGKKPLAQQMKIEECSDKSGTDGDDSDAHSTAEITNLNGYESIFRPRQRELNRTPPIDEPFEDPSEAISMPKPVKATDPMNYYSTAPGVGNNRARPSPSGVRRSSQPTLPSGYNPAVGQSGRRGSSAGVHDIMKPQEVHMRPGSVSQPRPSSVYDTHSGSPMRAGYRTAVNLGALSGENTGEYLPHRPYSSHHPQPSAGYPSSPTRNYPSSPSRDPPPPSFNVPQVPEYTPAPSTSPTKSYPVNTNPNLAPSFNNTRPLDRPTHVRRSVSETPVAPPAPTTYPETQKSVDHQEESENLKLIPSMSDKPTGLSADDFLPNQFGKMSVSNSSPFGWPQTELSESEVTSSILKGHGNMMAVLTARSRHIEILRQMWHSKDAKTAAEQAVAFNDQSVIVDLLSVIVLRPSIWNLDICNILLPSIGQLLLSKYESYVNNSAAAMKLILKNFATVIKSNIDNPNTAVGVDISKEERANKCMECYKELVKIRSGILKRQTMQGKAGHAYRELAILMQYLD